MADETAQSSATRQGHARAATNSPVLETGGGVGGMRTGLERAGKPGQLLWDLIATTIRNPRGFWGDVRDDLAMLVRKIFLPGTVAVLGYGTLIVTFALVILGYLGAPNRMGGVYTVFVLRETGPYLTGLVVAGVAGTATTSELGARKVREELDALLVLGQNPLRLLVLPRVIAMTILTVGLYMYLFMFQTLQGLVGTVLLGDTAAGAFLSSFLTNLTIFDVVGALFKMVIMGVFIAVVCASKGLNASGGAEGVGRAVNEAVVVSVLASFFVSIFYNILLLGIFPETSVLR
jgi:phospholipid/cholesterol/gamma-HCH transport system permease protein